MFTYWSKRVGSRDLFLSNLLNVPCVFACVFVCMCVWNTASYEFVCGLGVWPCSTLETHKSVCVRWVQLTWWSECSSKQTSGSAFSSQSPLRMFRRKRESTNQKNMHVRKEKCFFLTGSLCVVLYFQSLDFSEKEAEPENVCTRVCETPLFSCAVVCACLYWHQWESCGAACCANQNPDWTGLRSVSLLSPSLCRDYLGWPRHTD